MHKNIVFGILLGTILLAGCIGSHINIHKTSTVEVVCPLFTVRVTGAGTNAETINALGKYGVFEGARLTIEAIQKLTPILAQYGYRARISASEVIIEPIPRDMIVSIENRYPRGSKRVTFTLYDEQGNQLQGQTLLPQEFVVTSLKVGKYNVKWTKSDNPGYTESQDIAIPDDNHKVYSELARQEVDYWIFWPK